MLQTGQNVFLFLFCFVLFLNQKLTIFIYYVLIGYQHYFELKD